MSFFVVIHSIQDEEKWGKFFADRLAEQKDLSVADAAALPIYEGNSCLFTGSGSGASGSGKAVCFWKMKDEGMTAEDAKAFLDRFTGGMPIVQNECYKMIEGSWGLQNLSSEIWFKDLAQLATTGKTQGFADNGDLYFVHHKIPDMELWGKMVAEKSATMKGASTADDIFKAYNAGEGKKPCTWIGLGDSNACCLWSMPKTCSEQDFQSTVDTFTAGTNATNEIVKLEGSNAIGSRLIHPDFYAQEAMAFVNAS